MSRVIEDLLPQSREEVRRRFMEAMAADLRVAATDPFASHVIEKLLFLAAFRKGEDSDGDFAEYRLKLKATLHYYPRLLLVQMDVTLYA